jgi:hypothetical protein
MARTWPSGDPAEEVMKRSKCNRIVLACSVGLLFVARADAADINGLWVKFSDESDESACSRIFADENNRTVIYESGGFDIDDKEIRAKSGACQIKARKDDGIFVELLLDCPPFVAENEITLRIDGKNKLTRIAPGMPDKNTTYFRCTH